MKAIPKKFITTTITDRADLQKELEIICRQGYVFSKGELVSEVACQAAPVVDHDNVVCTALTIAGPEQRFTAERRTLMLTQLLNAPHQLSLLLGNQGECVRPMAASQQSP